MTDKPDALLTEGAHLSAEQWLATEGFADSRPHSSVDIAALMERYTAPLLARLAQITEEKESAERAVEQVNEIRNTELRMWMAARDAAEVQLAQITEEKDMFQEIAERTCAAHPDAERLSGCEECVAIEISATRQRAEQAEATLREAHDLVSRKGQPANHDFRGCLIDSILSLQEGLALAAKERDGLTADLARLRTEGETLIAEWREKGRGSEQSDALEAGQTFTECADRLSTLFRRPADTQEDPNG